MYEFLWRCPQPIGVGLIVISMGVLFLTFPGRHSHFIIAPGLIRFLGVPFGVVYIVVQLAMLSVMRSYKGIALTVFFMALGVGLMAARKTLVPWPMHLDPSIGHTFARHIVVAASCAEGVAVGLAFVSGWLSRRK